MDFFSAGGFQQLFSDLDEQLEHHEYENDDDFPSPTTDLYSLDNLTTIPTTTTVLTHDHELNEVHNNLSLTHSHSHSPSPLPPPPPPPPPIIYDDNIYCENVELFGAQKDTISSYAYYEVITLSNRINDAEDNQLNETQNFLVNDWNNNSYHNDDDVAFHMNEKQIQQSFEDLMLPIEDDESNNELGTDDLITREMADWEERFLDNYIEIPELIDFLPEKTPLCTDECELFLQESTKNLRLHRKRKTTTMKTTTTKSSSANCDADKVGYTCNFGNCQKIYAKPAHLKAHLRRHLGEKPYICNWPDCTWKFSRSDELARHRRSHSGVKPYKCDYCTKAFARSDHLTKHRKVHERRLLAASKAGKVLDAAALPYSILTVRPGRKRKNQIC